MILKDVLYKVISIDGMLVTVQLIPDNEIYRAHFPGMPITPGVCIIAMCRELAQIISGRELRLKVAKDVKFVNLLTPDSPAAVQVEFSGFDDGPDCLAVSATVSRDGIKIARLSLVLE